MLSAQIDDGAKFAHVSDKDCDLHNFIQGSTRSGEGTVQVLKRLLTMCGKPACDDLPIVIVAGLSGDEHKRSRLDGLRQQVWRVGIGLCGYTFNFHRFTPT